MYIVRLKLPSELSNEKAHRLAEGLVDLALSSVAMREDHKYDGAWVLEWLIDEKPLLADLAMRLSLQAAAYNIPSFMNIAAHDLEIEEAPDDVDWLQSCYEGFEPFHIGAFFIHGSHYEGSIPKDSIPLQIDAATAFGSGEHGTTKACLLALLDLNAEHFDVRNALDMGTGSGILAVGAYKLWGCRVLGVDNDPESIRVSAHHAVINGINDRNPDLSMVLGDGFATSAVQKNKPYGLILANILAGPVIEMAPALVDVLDNNGCCVLSGMLSAQADLVLSAYEGEGLVFRERYDIGEWTTLVLQKK
ncbi:MAG: 50S ribosomal protein L11 methyltransferase [Alphaproteobacteria bacterium]